jgi:hypothetical protein
MELLHYFDEATSQAVHARRKYLSKMIRSQCDSVVQYGILKGFRVPHSNWAEVISSAYILGTYEISICAILDKVRGPNKVLIDLGGADGIFGVGLVEAGAFGQSLIFEMDPGRRHALSEMAQAHGVANRVAVLGEATPEFLGQVEGHGVALDRSVVLCDIEGAEFTLFTDDVLSRLQNSHVIIELHDFLLADPARRENAVAELKRSAERYFDVCEIKDGLRDIRNIPLLRNWSDWDSWLLCVEARYRMMSWLWLRPKGEPPLTGAALDALVMDYQRRIFTT